MWRVWTILARCPLVLGIAMLMAQSEPTSEAPPPLVTCSQEQIGAALVETGEYTTSTLAGFVQIDGQALTLNGTPYVVRGVNYYPSRYPWRRFLTETPTIVFRSDLRQMRQAGFNTLRLFLWNEALFQCPGSGAVPNPDNMHRLDSMLRVAGEEDFRLIITLNDLPDLVDYPLYSNPAHIELQTRYLVERYRDEAAILAWDLRNEGDIDYGTHHAIVARATKEQVLRWLGITAAQVRAIDSNHLITAGWLFDAEATAPYVDFISFHHWTSADELRSRIDAMRAATNKPLLLEEFGYSTQRVSFDEQAASIADVATTAETSGLLGWMVWTAFDFPTDRSCYPSPCQSPNNGEHYFGLWTVDDTPKPALDAVIELMN
jgi:endo-1,4-beta-mannosidase